MHAVKFAPVRTSRYISASQDKNFVGNAINTPISSLSVHLIIAPSSRAHIFMLANWPKTLSNNVQFKGRLHLRFSCAFLCPTNRLTQRHATLVGKPLQQTV
jgi:hypothetical protein